MRLKHLLSVFFTLLTLGVGQMWGTLPNNPKWTATALADIADDATVIIMSSSDYALPSTTTSSSPAKISCTISTTNGISTITPASGTLQNLAWTVAKLTSSWKFYQEGSNSIHLYLSGTGSNTALRVGSGSSNDQFVMGSSGKLLKVTTANRYVGPYSGGSDWRTYNSETHDNYNSATLTFYVLNTGGGNTPTLTPNTSSLNWETVLQGSSPSTKSFTISGSNLTGNLTVATTGGYSVSCGNSINVTSGSPAITSITVTPPSTSTAGTQNGTVTFSGGGLSANVTVNLGMTVEATYTCTWHAGPGVKHTQTAAAGTALTDPGVPSSVDYCDGIKEFVGWTATPIVGTTNTVPTDLFISYSGLTMPSSDKDYYAVYATQSAFNRVQTTSDLGDSKWIVVVDAYNSKTLNNDLSASTAPTENASSQITPELGMIWQLESSNSNWKFKTGTMYLKGDANPTNSNKTKTISLNTSGNLTWVIDSNSYTDNGTPVFSIRNASSNNAGLEYASTWKLFYTTNLNTSYYTEKLYVATRSNYATTCCTPLAQINGSFS